MNAEINDNVVLLDDDEDLIIYRCPIAGLGELADHTLFVTSRISDIVEGQIMSSEQADGVLHKVGLVSHLGNSSND